MGAACTCPAGARPSVDGGAEVSGAAVVGGVSTSGASPEGSSSPPSVAPTAWSSAGPRSTAPAMTSRLAWKMAAVSTASARRRWTRRRLARFPPAVREGLGWHMVSPEGVQGRRSPDGRFSACFAGRRGASSPPGGATPLVEGFGRQVRPLGRNFVPSWAAQPVQLIGNDPGRHRLGRSGLNARPPRPDGCPPRVVSLVAVSPVAVSPMALDGQPPNGRRGRRGRGRSRGPR